MGAIYLITNKINNQKYVGLTTRTVEIRWKEHIRRSSEAIDKAIAKYGKENFTIETLEECPDELLDEKEQYWIAYYDSYNKGYNCTGGGRDNKKINKPQALEQIPKLWDEGKGQKEIANILNINIETAHNYLIISGITKEDIRIRANEKIGKSKSKAVLQFDTNNNFIKEWPSATEAGKFYGKAKNPYATIAKACNGNLKTAYGYIWKYKESK